jgi:hypothetical protein
MMPRVKTHTAESRDVARDLCEAGKLHFNLPLWKKLSGRVFRAVVAVLQLR